MKKYLSLLLFALLAINCKKTKPIDNIDKNTSTHSHYTVVLTDPEHEYKFKTIEISPDKNGFKEERFAEGFVVRDIDSLWRYHVDELHIPNLRNCNNCPNSIPDCENTGRDLVPQLTFYKPSQNSKNYISQPPRNQPSELWFSLESSRVSQAGPYLSITNCYKHHRCDNIEFVTCSNELFTLTDKLKTMTLEPFEKLQPIDSKALLMTLLKSTSEGSETHQVLLAAQKNNSKFKLVEVMFSKNRIFRRWIIPAANNTQRYGANQNHNDPGWSSGTYSYVDDILVPRYTDDPTLSPLQLPRIVAIYIANSNQKVVGWGDGRLE